MDLSLSADALSQVPDAAQEMVEAVAGTVSGNFPWFLLVATVGAILFVVWYIMRRLATLGR